MFIETNYLLYPMLVVAIAAAFTDLARGRIYNWLTFPAMLSGVIACGIFGGWAGAGNAVLGLLIGFVLYGWMFWIGMMGAGDVKLLMALGAWGGVRFVLETGILGIVLGGVMAVGFLIFSGRFVDFVKRMHHFILTLVVKELTAEKPKIDRTATMPYGVPIAVAAIWVALFDPFSKWGGFPW